MPVELSVLLPCDQVRLCDAWEQRHDAEAEVPLRLVTWMRDEIKNLAGPHCLACDVPLLTTEAVTYCVAHDGVRARCGAICPTCTELYCRRDLCLIASRSLADCLTAELADQLGRPGSTFVSTPGNA